MKEQLKIPSKNILLEGLNKEQLNAVKHAGGPLLIVAGAGTGKTTVITRRIAYLVEQKFCRLDEIAALTFTEKAAGEMQERVDLLLPVGYVDTWIHTFHGFCDRILKSHALDIGIPNDFNILSDTQQWIFIYKHLEEFDLDYYKPLGNPGKFISALLNHFSRLKDEIISPEDYLDYASNLKLNTDSADGIDEAEISRQQELANAYFTYQKLLLQNNYLDFGDLIHYTLRLFKKRPAILKKFQDKFKFLMVDEFQDTNLAQYELVKLLAGELQNLTVVGDDDQSIYKFRGASVSNILKFKEDYPKFKQVTLVENYRSGQAILDLAYKFIQNNNPDRLEVKLKISKELKSNIKDKGSVEVIEADDLTGELNAVVRKIVALKNKSDVTWNDFAILLRANSAAEDLLPLLYNAGVPYTFFASRGLYKKPVILDLLSYMRLLDNLHDSQSLYKVFTLPKFQIDQRDLSTLLLYGHKKALSLYDVLGHSASVTGLAAATHKKIDLLFKNLQYHYELNKTKHAAEITVQIIKDLGIEDKVKEETLEAAENRELVEQFYKKVEEFGRQNDDKSLHNFLRLLDLEMEAGSSGNIKFNPEAGPESLKVMTIHGSKGLEFKYVFVINMVDQRFPTREKADAIEIPMALVKDILPEGDFHLQEERRLFYVGLTRAKTNLYLTWAKDYGGAREKKPSLFLTECGLVPGEKANKATGKVVFTKTQVDHGPVKFAPPTQFSYSQLNDFETCPLKYKYQHYLKLPVEGSCHLSFGQTIHKVFEEYLKLYKTNLELPQQDLFGGKQEQILPEFKYLEELYQKKWVDDWYKDKKEKADYRARGQAMLKTFYDELQKDKFVPKYIEQFFKLKVGKYDFVGKIDRADVFQGGIRILDYKTGKQPKKSDKKDLDQLYIYQWAAQDFLHEKVTGLKYWFLLENETKEEPVADGGKIRDLEEKLLSSIEHIVEVTKYDLFKQEHNKARDHKCGFEFLE
jgi:DNA helicase-2/ATP-dependent DNA helicase PcrA